jgi:hypothetical protein
MKGLMGLSTSSVRLEGD